MISNKPFKLKEAIKADLQTISKMEFDVINADDFYHPIIRFIFLAFITLCSVTLIDIGIVNLTGIYNKSQFISHMKQMGLSLMVLTLFATVFIYPYVQFARFAKKRLIIGPFFNKKLRQLFVLFCSLYGVFVFIGINIISDKQSLLYDSEGMLFVQAFSFIPTIIISAFIQGMELQRLGLGSIIEVVNGFLSRLQHQSVINK